MKHDSFLPPFVWGLCCIRRTPENRLLLTYAAPGLAAMLGLAADVDLRTLLTPEDAAALTLPPVGAQRQQISVVFRLHTASLPKPAPVRFSGVWEQEQAWGVVTSAEGESLPAQAARLQQWYGGFRDLLQSTNQQAYEWDFSAGTLTEAGYQSAYWREVMRTELPSRLTKDGMPNDETIYSADRHAFRQLHESVANGGAGGTVELRMRTGYGVYRWCRLSLSALYGADGRPCKAVGLLADIEYEKRAQQELLRRVSRDGLTGLYTAETFSDQLPAALARRQGKPGAFALICVNNYSALVHRLGWVDTRGVLVRLASRLQELVLPQSLYGRVAEDTFALFFPATSEESAQQSADRLVNELRFTVPVGLQSERVTVSLGFAYTEQSDADFSALLHQADLALGSALTLGDCAVLYHRELERSPGAGVRFVGVGTGIAAGSFDNHLLFTFFNRLYTSEDSSAAVREILQLAGEHYRAARAYVYLSDEEDPARMQPVYEWDAEGVTPRPAMDRALLAGPNPTAEHFFCDDTLALPEPLARFFKRQNTGALAQYNLYENGALCAAVGFDTCGEKRLWRAEEKESLSFCLKLLGGFLLRVERPERIGGRDPLTGLQLWPRFRQRATRRLSDESGWYLVLLDIVRFRDINELFGTTIGDKLLARFALAVRRRLSENELACRRGSSSVAILLHRESPDAVRRWTEDFQKSLITTCRAMIGTHRLTVAVGMVAAGLGDDAADLLEKAQLACASAKQTGSAFVQYDLSLTRQYLLRQTIRKNQQTALEDREFALYLQPKYDARSGRVTGAGAWVRWNTKTDGQLKNSQFLPVFRENGFVLDLDYELIDLICTALSEWPDFCRVPISLRIDRLHFVMEDFVPRLTDICARHGIEPKFLCLELQEDVFLGDRTRRSQILTELRGLGFRFMLSGFGQGWSSLDVLTDCPLDVLRLDGSFFAGPDDGKRRIAGTVCAMAHELGLLVTAEGVNSALQADFLRGIGVDELQGDWFVPTLSAAEYFEQICTD